MLFQINFFSAPNNKTVLGDCIDTDIQCAYWASQGECQKNPGYMLTSCPLSCNQCKEECTNLNIHCEHWADAGECSINPTNMGTNCAKACGTCGKTISKQC